MDVQLFVEALQPVLHAAQRKVTAARNRLVRQAQRNINKDFIFGIGKAMRLAEAFFL
ncbi:hypothetical protein D3C87_1988240 [compost metagenome]